MRPGPVWCRYIGDKTFPTFDEEGKSLDAEHISSSLRRAGVISP